VLAHFVELWPALLALLFVDLFDNMGTLIGVCQRAGIAGCPGNLPRIGRALAADAGRPWRSACLGTSPSPATSNRGGVEEGGRTGLTALVVALCFLLALCFSPVILAVPAVADRAGARGGGIFMMQGVTRLDLADFSVAAPCV